MAKMRDVAELAQVSVSTVSKYLNRPDELTEPYKTRVANAISQLNYKPNYVAQSLRSGATNIIGLVVPDISNVYYVETYNVVRAELNELGLMTQLFTIEENPNIFNELLDNLLASRVDGIIFGFVDEDYIEQKINKISEEIPIVLMSWNMDVKLDAVVVDLNSAIYDTTEHLIELGHNRIAYVGGVPDSRISLEKENGFRRAMSKHGLCIDEEMVSSGEYTFRRGYMSARQLMRQANPPTAIACANDVLAIGCCMFLLESGYRIPEDVAITGMDGIQLSNIYTPSITTSVEPVEAMCHEAIRLLQSRIKAPNAKPKKSLFATALSIRRSTVVDAPIIFID